jgi:hypothetical protein
MCCPGSYLTPWHRWTQLAHGPIVYGCGICIPVSNRGFSGGYCSTAGTIFMTLGSLPPLTRAEQTKDADVLVDVCANPRSLSRVIRHAGGPWQPRLAASPAPTTPSSIWRCRRVPAVWLGSTFHGASRHTTTSLRVGTQMGFNCGWLRPNEAYLLLVPPLVARDLPLNVQEVLDYRAHRGMLWCIEQESPLQRLAMVHGRGHEGNP